MRWTCALTLLMACGSDTAGTGTTSSTPNTGTSAAGTTGTTATPCSAQVVHPGEGEFAYEAREDGDRVTIVRGPQGGWHIDLAAEVNGYGELVDVLPSITNTEAGSIAGQGQENDAAKLLAGYDDATCTGQFFQARAYIDDLASTGDYIRVICPLQGKTLEVCLNVVDVATGNGADGCFSATASLDDWTVDACAAL